MRWLVLLSLLALTSSTLSPSAPGTPPSQPLGPLSCLRGGGWLIGSTRVTASKAEDLGVRAEGSGAAAPQPSAPQPLKPQELKKAAQPQVEEPMLRGGGNGFKASYAAVDTSTQLQNFMEQLTEAAEMIDTSSSIAHKLQKSLNLKQIEVPAPKANIKPANPSIPQALNRPTPKKYDGTRASKLLRAASEEIVAALNSFETRLSKLTLWTVKFQRRAKIQYGDALYVVGEAEGLGAGDIKKAVKMTHQGDNVWTIICRDIPENTRYRYLIKRHHSNQQGSDHHSYQTEYPFEVSSTLDSSSITNGILIQDDSEQLVRFKISRENCDAVSVTGSIPSLGSWDPKKALRLDNTRGNTFEKVVTLPSDELLDFEYKFFETSSGKYESGPNRKSDAGLTEPQREMDLATGQLGKKRIIDLACVWEGLLVRLVIYHPLEEADAVLACSGSHPALGSWLGAPRKMGLGNERTLLTGVKGRCWEATFPAGDEDVTNVQYRYCIIAGQDGTSLFEREPNRKIDKIPGSKTSMNIEKSTLGVGRPMPGGGKGYRQREYRAFDGNFVPPHLSYDEIPPVLCIGPYPQSAADVETMKKAGVTGVMNVQTDGDHERRLINWNAMLKYYKEADISVTRLPIEDFNAHELAVKLKDAARAVDKMVNEAKSQGKKPKVYIHCTAGMGRAPAVACVYLVWRHNFNLQDALAHCKAHRSVCAPSWHAMEQALREGGF